MEAECHVLESTSIRRHNYASQLLLFREFQKEALMEVGRRGTDPKTNLGLEIPF